MSDIFVCDVQFNNLLRRYAIYTNFVVDKPDKFCQIKISYIRISIDNIYNKQKQQQIYYTPPAKWEKQWEKQKRKKIWYDIDKLPTKN